MPVSRRIAPRSCPLAPWLLVAAVVAAVSVAASPAPVEAQRRSSSVDISRPHTGQRPLQLDIHAGFTWWGVGFATGARFGIPILNDGFVPSINNAVYINIGLDFYWTRWACRVGPGGCSDWEYGPGLGIPVALHWEFYFHENWSAFVELGFQVFFHPRFFNNGVFDAADGGYWFVGAIGGSFHVDENVLLTLRIGTPYAAFGITLQF
jgi:hypothetical protein